MKINIIKAFSAVLLIGIFAIPAFVLAESGLQTDGADVNGASVSFTTGGSDTNGAGSAFTTGGSDTNGASASFTTDGADTNGADESFTTGGANTNGADVAVEPVTPSVTPPTSGGSTGGSSGYSSSGGRRPTVPIPALINAGATCSVYLNDYLKFGGNNSIIEVTKLQTFLKNTEKINVDVNGIFDVKTFEAVKTLQRKYINEIMAPWGSSIPSGQVYFTTKNKINEIYCNTKLPLTAVQLAQIESYKKGVQNGTVNTRTNNIKINSTDTNSTSPEITPEVGISESDTQTAATANVSSSSKIWKFIKWIFGY